MLIVKIEPSSFVRSFRMIQDLENLVRSGQFAKVAEFLRSMKLGKIARMEQLAYANIATRIGDLRIALRILNPTIRGQTSEPPTPEEKIQYANALRKLGAVSEAEEILRSIDARALPEAFLHLAFCLVSRWEYVEAISLLESFLASPGVAPYRRSVAQVNLLAALVHEQRHDEVSGVLMELQKVVGPTETPLLHGNVLELRAQLAIQTREWDSAISLLAEAAALMRQADGSVGSLQIDKWRVVAMAEKERRAPIELRTIQKRAIEQGQWEAARDCEYHLAKFAQDEPSLLRLYFGTPYGSYRRKIEKLVREVPDTWDWSFGPLSEGSFDLARAASLDGSLQLKAGHMSHRLLIALSQDFYRPASVISLFSQIFSGDYFNPDTSPNRVHQGLKRLRGWLEENRAPARLEESSGHYRLQIIRGNAIRLSRDPLSTSHQELELTKLRAALAGQEFTAKEAESVLGCSRASTQRLLRWASERGKLKLEGHTNRARYRLVA